MCKVNEFHKTVLPNKAKIVEIKFLKSVICLHIENVFAF